MGSSTKLSISFFLALVVTLVSFTYALGSEGVILSRGLPIPYIIDGSLKPLNFLFDILIWGAVWFSFLRLISEFGRNVKDAILIYGIVLFIILILTLSYLVFNRYQIIIKGPSG